MKIEELIRKIKTMELEGAEITESSGVLPNLILKCSTALSPASSVKVLCASH